MAQRDTAGKEDVQGPWGARRECRCLANLAYAARATAGSAKTRPGWRVLFVAVAIVGVGC